MDWWFGGFVVRWVRWFCDTRQYTSSHVNTCSTSATQASSPTQSMVVMTASSPPCSCASQLLTIPTVPPRLVLPTPRRCPCCRRHLARRTIPCSRLLTLTHSAEATSHSVLCCTMSPRNCRSCPRFRCEPSRDGDGDGGMCVCACLRVPVGGLLLVGLVS